MNHPNILVTACIQVLRSLKTVSRLVSLFFSHSRLLFHERIFTKYRFRSCVLVISKMVPVLPTRYRQVIAFLLTPLPPRNLKTTHPFLFLNTNVGISRYSNIFMFFYVITLSLSRNLRTASERRPSMPFIIPYYKNPTFLPFLPDYSP